MPTSKSSKKRSKKSSSKKPASSRRSTAFKLDRPFDIATIRKAEKIANSYRLVFEPDPDLGFLGRSVEMPYVMADGKSIQNCAEQTIEALTSAIATLLEAGERPPSAAAAGKRDRQVNVRVTADEKMRLEELAQREGFRSTSDFMRAAALKAS